MISAEDRLEDTRRIILSARARIWPIIIALLLTLLSSILPVYQSAVTDRAESRERLELIVDRVTRLSEEGLLGPDRLGEPGDDNRLRRVTNDATEALGLAPQNLEEIAFELFGQKLTLPFQWAPTLWIAIATALIYILVSARQRSVNFFVHALQLSSTKPAHLLSNPPIWVAPLYISHADKSSNVELSDVLNGFGWSRSHNALFTVWTLGLTWMVFIGQVVALYVSYATHLAECTPKESFWIWPVASACNIGFADTVMVTSNAILLVASFTILVVGVMPIRIRRLEEAPSGLIMLGRRRVVTSMLGGIAVGAIGSYASPPVLQFLRRDAYGAALERFNKTARRLIPRNSQQRRLPYATTDLAPGLYVSRSRVIHAVERRPNNYDSNNPSKPLDDTNSIRVIRGVPANARGIDEMTRLSAQGFLRQLNIFNSTIHLPFASGGIERLAISVYRSERPQAAIDVLGAAIEWHLLRGSNASGGRLNVRWMDLLAGMLRRESLDELRAFADNLEALTADLELAPKFASALEQRIRKWNTQIENMPGNVFYSGATFFGEWAESNAGKKEWKIPRPGGGFDLYKL